MKKRIDFQYIDIHSHILPGVDDGSRDLNMSTDMIKTAYQEGIRLIVVTPHYHPAKCSMNYNELLQHYSIFKAEMKKICPQMKLILGREIFYSSDILEDLENDEHLTIGKSDYMLVEFEPGVEFSYLRNSINNLIQMGCIPIIAHVERYNCLVEDWKLVEELYRMGALIQVNQSAVLGESGGTIKKFVKILLKKHLVHVIGTDAHSNGRRSPRLEKCAVYICKKYGYEYARLILRDHAIQIIQGKYLED